MNIENFEYLKKQLEKRGWEVLGPQLEENIVAGKDSFELYHTQSFEGLSVDYELQFKKHAEHPFYYFNRINAALSEGEQVLAQASFRESWKLMPEEMYQILQHGDKVAVYKEGIKNEAGDPFNAWITVNADMHLDENGSLNLNTYHDKYYKKYPFDLDYSLSKLPAFVREQLGDGLDAVKDSLKQGTPYPINIDRNGVSEPGFLSVNAKVGRIDILDSSMEHLPVPEKKEQQADNISNGQGPASIADAEKKKTSLNQARPNHFKTNRPGRGLSR